MKVILNENKFMPLITNIIMEFNNYDGNSEHNPYQKKIDDSISSLEKLLAIDGTIMVNIENGKYYLVYEIVSLSNIIGKRYCLCQLIKDNEPYGSIYTKPMDLFKLKNY